MRGLFLMRFAVQTAYYIAIIFSFIWYYKYTLSQMHLHGTIPEYAV